MREGGGVREEGGVVRDGGRRSERGGWRKMNKTAT